MYKYTLKNDINNIKYQKLFDDYFPDRAEHTKNFIASGKPLKYFMCALKDEEPVGVMGIILMNVKHFGIHEDNYYRFSNLVVSKEHSGRGVGTGIIRTAVKSLIDIGAVKIRNHKSSNVIPHTVFTDMGFELIKYIEDHPTGYKWIYELYVNKVDMVSLNKIWKKYKIVKGKNEI